MRIISGEFKNRKISPPGLKRIRPTTEYIREMVFSIIGPDRIRGAHFLDLYCGTGAIGLEALSRGAATCTFVDSDFRLTGSLASLVKEWNLSERATVVNGDAVKWLHSTAHTHDPSVDGDSTPFAYAFADPPYFGGNIDRIRNAIGTLMAAISIAKRLFSSETVLFLELPRSVLGEQSAKSGASSRRTKLKNFPDRPAGKYNHQFDALWPEVLRSLAIPLEFPLLDWRLTGTTAILMLGALQTERIREIL